MSTPTLTRAAAPQPPAVGERWPGIDGTYAGIARGEDGQPNGHLILLDARQAWDLNHADATAWAEGQGNGARLPTRFESALLYATLCDHTDTAGRYWTSTLESDGYAWCQRFGSGNQYTHDTDYGCCAVAVIRIPVSAVQPADVSQWPAWQPMRTAPKDGTPVLLLLNGSDIPHAALWLSGPDDPRATDETAKPGWYITWDGYQVTEYDGPAYWMPLPPDPGEAAQPADVARHPTPEDARKMGEKGGPVVEAERLAFEAWMAGHCWPLCATWNGKEYRGDAEAGHYICPRAMNTRQLWAAWRDRAALAAKGGA